MRKKWFKLKGKNIVNAHQELLSFVFVRDPISRIISSYYDKMFGDWKKPHFDLNWMRKEIIHKYRHIDPMSTDEAPTPSEFVQYILDSADTLGSHHLDPHIRPIWASCPFCTIDFDIIGHLEDRDSDALFIANKLKFGVRQTNTYQTYLVLFLW